LLSAIDPSVVLIDHKARVIPLQAAPLLQGDLLDIACIGIALTGQPQRFPGFESLAPTPAVENYRVDAGHVHYRTEPVRRARGGARCPHCESRSSRVHRRARRGGSKFHVPPTGARTEDHVHRGRREHGADPGRDG
jgi:hypothetical protein